jgi:hypothetical protein
MCAIADFYGISILKTLAQRKFKEAVGKHSDYPEFTEVVALACKPQLSEDATVWDTIIEAIIGHPSLLDKPEIEVILSEAPHFTLALLKQAVKRPDHSKWTWN